MLIFSPVTAVFPCLLHKTHMVNIQNFYRSNIFVLYYSLYYIPQEFFLMRGDTTEGGLV
jgi:hypothetical protein